MEALARERGWQRGIELGLGHGLLFRRFLALGIEMVGVDLGRIKERKRVVQRILADAIAPPAIVHWMPTAEAAALVPDEWADFVFIDAAHSYKAVKDDIARWQPKVKPGAWFGGHDYHPAHPGVVRAVDEAFGERIELLPGYVWARSC